MDDGNDGAVSQSPDGDLREQAIEAIRRKRKFWRDAVIYVLVNAFLWIVWAVEGARTEDLWPAWVSGIWGALLILDAFKTYAQGPVSEQQIADEMKRLERR